MPFSLRSLSKKIKEQFGLLDLIICNAAMVAKRSRPVSQGLDEMFVVNYFAKFLLQRDSFPDLNEAYENLIPLPLVPLPT